VGHCLSGVCNYYLPWKYLTLVASTVRSRRLTASAMWHGSNIPLVNYIPVW
jgi:hypothetical protein